LGHQLFNSVLTSEMLLSAQLLKVKAFACSGCFNHYLDEHAMQMMFTCVSMVLTLTIFAYILGEISNLVMDQDAELVKTRSQVCSLL